MTPEIGNNMKRKWSGFVFVKTEKLVSIYVMKLYQFLYYPENSDQLTSPVRNATKMPRGGAVCSDANAKMNSQIVIRIVSPQRTGVTVIVHWCMNQSVLA